MGKKRVTTATLTKAYASNPASSSGQQSRTSLSVTDKLSKLRLEGLQHERNTQGTSWAVNPVRDTARHSQVIPEISELLGQEYVQPQSRLKARNRGHLAPKSWTAQTDASRRNGNAVTSTNNNSEDTLHSLVDQCLAQIVANISIYLDCGMNHLPGYMKSYILSHSYPGMDDALWRDLVPDNGDEDEISVLDLTLTKPTLSCLRRLTGLRDVAINVSQIESAIAIAIPTVLQVLTIRPLEIIIESTPASKAFWRRLSSHLIALRSIILDLRYIDLASQIGLDTLLGVLLEGPNWREAFETVRQITFSVSTKAQAGELSSSLTYLAFKGSLRKLRRKGRHVECQISSPEFLSHVI